MPDRRRSGVARWPLELGRPVPRSGPESGASLIRVTIFEAAMVPMIGASIVAQEHKLDPPLITRCRS